MLKSIAYFFGHLFYLYINKFLSQGPFLNCIYSKKLINWAAFNIIIIMIFSVKCETSPRSVSVVEQRVKLH